MRSSGSYAPDGDAVRVVNKFTANDLRNADVVVTGRRSTRMRTNELIRRAHGITSPLPLMGEPLVCLRNAQRYGLCNGAVYYASRDLQEDDKTVGISTDNGDIEVHAQCLRPGHEYDKLDFPWWMTAFAFGYGLTVHMAQCSEFDKVLLIDEWSGDDCIPWLYTGITRAAKRITIARRS